MANPTDNRVLSRLGARELTFDEVKIVSGGIEQTHVCTGFNPATHTGADGDGCSGDTDVS